MLPSGSLNHATLSPVGAVQIPRSSCLKNPKISNCTPFCFQCANDVFDTCDLPAENREWRRREIFHFGGADHDAVRLEHHGKAIVLHKAQSQHALVERSRASTESLIGTKATISVVPSISCLLA